MNNNENQDWMNVFNNPTGGNDQPNNNPQGGMETATNQNIPPQTGSNMGNETVTPAMGTPTVPPMTAPVESTPQPSGMGTASSSTPIPEPAQNSAMSTTTGMASTPQETVTQQNMSQPSNMGMPLPPQGSQMNQGTGVGMNPMEMNQPSGVQGNPMPSNSAMPNIGSDAILGVNSNPIPPMPQPTAMNQNLGGVGQPGAMAEMNINPQMNMMNQMANNGNNGTVPPAQGGMNTTSAPSSTPAPKKNIINMLVPIVAIIIVIFIAFFLLNYFGIIGGKSLTCTATLDDEAGLGMSASSTISAKIKDDKILSADYDMTLNYEPDSLIGASIQMDEETFRESMRESYPGAAIEITDSQVKISGTAKTDDELDGLDMSKNMSEDEFRTFCESSGGTVK